MLLAILLAVLGIPPATATPALDPVLAERFTRLALACVHQEYPNKIAHVMNADADARPPRELTPSFYGCYDWHSSVHGHWLLARVARLAPETPLAAEARQALAQSLTPANVAAEVSYLEGKGRTSFERPYGLAWLLQLATELREWGSPEARAWAETLAPLERAAAARIREWLPKLTQPIRVGEHSQTGFGLGLVLDWARAAGDAETERLVVARSRDFYAGDRDCPLAYEPSGEDFLSPCLGEADLMRRVLKPAEYARWLDGFLPGLPRDGRGDWLSPGIVTDPTDPKLAHLDGLNLSRAWMLEGMASGLPEDDARVAALQAAAAVHRAKGLAAVTGEHYEGGHWLGTFAIYLVTSRGLTRRLEIGDPAPDFDLPGIDGRRYTLASFAAAKALVLVFTANHCPTAQAYEGRIEKLDADFRSRGARVVLVSPNDPLALRLDEQGYSDLGDTFEEMKLRARDRGWSMPYLYDGETQAMSRRYGPVATPHVFVFDAERKLRFKGRIDDNQDPAKATTADARTAIEAVLAGRPVPVATTKVFGCSVKWSDKRASVEEGYRAWAKEPVGLETIDGAGVRALARNEDGPKLRLINVWATWCGPCVIEFPDLVSLHRIYRGREFEVVTLNADEPEKRAKALEFLKTQQASTRNYAFETDDPYALIEAADPQWQGALPHTLLVAPGGQVLYRSEEAFDMLALRRAIVGWLGRYYHSTPGKR
jgi:thiol-disulfide isomerase/thioredoxin